MASSRPEPSAGPGRAARWAAPRLRRHPGTWGTPVSLGGGCDVLTELLGRHELSHTSHFFDSLWNLDGGLRTVTRIVEERFAGFERPELYVLRRHPEWNTPESPGRLRLACGDLQAEQIVHANHPEVAFIHWPGGPGLAERFARKAERFLRLLEGREPVTFLYYRQLHSPVHGRYLCGPDEDVEEKLATLRAETEEFVAAISRLHPSLPLRILSCFLTPARPVPAVADAVERFFRQAPDTDRIRYRRVQRRRSPASLESWDALVPEL